VSGHEVVPVEDEEASEAQMLQDDMPLKDWNLPASHKVQLVAPLILLMLPAAQGMALSAAFGST